MTKKDITRREFFQTASKGVLALGGLYLGFNQACTRSEERSGPVGEKPQPTPKRDLIDLSRISTCSICLNHMSAEAAFPIIAAAGYKKVDIHEKVHLQIFPDLCDVKALKETADKNGLQIANLSTYAGGGLDGRQTAYKFHGWEVPHPERFTSVGFSSEDPEELKTEFEQIKHTIDIAAFVGARSIRVVPGDDEPESIDKVVPWFQRTAEYAEEKDVYMAFENHSAGIAGTPDLCVELAEKVGSPYFGILFEPGNLMFDTGTDYKKALETMKQYVTHVHFKDCKPMGEAYEMQHFGEGAIDFPWCVAQLEAVGYSGDYALEYELHHPEPEEGLKRFYNDYLALFETQ